MNQLNPQDNSSTQSLKRATLIVTTLASFLDPFMGASVNVALPTIGHQFAMSAVLLGWVNTAFLLAAAAFMVPFGRLGDIYGRKKIYIIGVCTFSTASVFLALSTSSTMLILFRVMQGLGASMAFATRLAILISVYPGNERGRVLGINVAAVYLGLSTGPFLGGLITQYLGWRFIFWINVPIGAMMLILIFWLLKGEWAEDRGLKFDLAGSIIFALALLSTMYGFSKLPEIYAAFLIAVGVLGIVIFINYELRVEAPIIDMSLFRHNTVFAFSNLAAMINYAATFAVSFLLSIYLQKVKGYSPQITGIIMVSQPAVQAIFSPSAGRLSDRIEPRTVASVGMGLTFVGLILMAFLNASSSLYYIIGCMMILGFGFALFSSPNTNAIMSSVERRYYGVAGAMVGTMRQTGMMVSMGIVMMILALYLGRAEIDAATLARFGVSMRIAFIVFAALCFGGIFASLARGKMLGAKKKD
jgi:EmrB/QacA subfamily drug resistance transporter